MRGEFLEAQFNQAAADYYYLLNKNYPEKRTRLLIADRYKLNSAQRTVLYRGVFSAAVNQKRSAKKFSAPAVKGQTLCIDVLNVIYLIMNYLYGRNLFIATDKFLRDDGENYSNFSSHSFFSQALTLIAKSLTYISPSAVEVVLDHPHTELPFEELQNSNALRKLLSSGDINMRVVLTMTADMELKQNEYSIIATSDSHIIDRWQGGVFDLGRFILNDAYSADFPDLSQVVEKA